MNKDTQQTKIKQGGKKAVLKANIKVNSIGKPDLTALPEAEKRIFFETLLARIKELCAEEDNVQPLT